MNKLETAVLGGGCFWCTEAIFQQLRGVESVTSGYAGGSTAKPTYEQVSSGKTGHAEVIKIEFDPSQISFEELLDVFWHLHDPTTLNQQGADVGSQYRSIILATTDKQLEQAERSKQEMDNSGEFAEPIVTELARLDKFYPAEDYHFDYYSNHSSQTYCRLVISPKLRKLREKYNAKLKAT